MSNYTHDYAAEYLSLFNKNGSKRQISNAAVLQMIGAAPASHIDVHASDAVYGHVKAASTSPEPLGTAYVGDSDEYARADHVHPMPEISGSAETADFAKALKNPFMLYLEGAAVAEDRVDGVTDVHLRILKLDAQALEGLINLDNLPIGTESGTIAAGNHTHDYSSVYAPYSHNHTSLDITDLSTVLSGYSPSGHGHNYAGSSSDGGAANSVKEKLKIKLNSGTATEYNGSTEREINITASAVGAATSGHNHDGVYAPVHTHPYLPLAGGAMESTCVLCTDILENRGWYFGLVNNSSNYDFSSGGNVTINTKIGASDNTTGLGDYCIRIRGYLVSNSSKTIDLFVYLSNTSSNTATVDVVTAHGYRNYGSINPGTLHIFKRNTTSGDGIKIYFTIPSDDRGTFAMNVDLISHDLAKANITNTSSPNSSDNKLLHGWTISNTIVPSGTYLECDSISTHAHEALSAGSGLKYASNGQTYTGTDERTLSVDVGANFDWTGVHSFPNTTKINLTGVLIGKGSSSAIGAVSTSTNRQFLCYNTTSPAGYKFLAITKNDIPNVESLNASPGAAGKILVSTGSSAYEWVDRGRYIKHSCIRLTSSTVVTLSDHVAGTDQMVYLIIEPTSISTTDFYIKVPSPSTSIAGDKIQFVAIYIHNQSCYFRYQI